MAEAFYGFTTAFELYLVSDLLYVKYEERNRTFTWSVGQFARELCPWKFAIGGSIKCECSQLGRGVQRL
jgi:hypothetical protein